MLQLATAINAVAAESSHSRLYERVDRLEEAYGDAVRVVEAGIALPQLPEYGFAGLGVLVFGRLLNRARKEIERLE